MRVTGVYETVGTPKYTGYVIGFGLVGQYLRQEKLTAAQAYARPTGVILATLTEFHRRSPPPGTLRHPIGWDMLNGDRPLLPVISTRRCNTFAKSLWRCLVVKRFSRSVVRSALVQTR
jgi:hypothetical protein